MSEGRDGRGKFTKGNQAGALRRPRLGGLKFAAWCRELFDDDERRARLVARIDRELEGDGPTTLVPRVLAYAFGEPRQVLEADLKVRASKLARLVGVDVETLLAEADRLSKEAGYETEN